MPFRNFLLPLLLLTLSHSLLAQASTYLLHDGEKVELRATHTAFLFDEEITASYIIKDKTIGKLVTATVVMGTLIGTNEHEIKFKAGKNDVVILALAFGDDKTKKVNHLETIYIPVVNESKTTPFLNPDGNPLIDKNKIHPLAYQLNVGVAMSATERCQDKVVVRKMKVSVKTGSRAKSETYYSSTVSLRDFSSVIEEGSILAVEILEAECIGPQGTPRKIYFSPPKNVLKSTFSFEAERPVFFRLKDVVKD